MRAVLPAIDPRQPSPRIGDLPDPVPGPGEVLVAVEAAGINHADLLQLRAASIPLRRGRARSRAWSAPAA